jgi:hypothetical protein
MSTLNCSSIAAGLVAASCTKLVVAGTGQKVIVLNYYDVDKPNCTVTNNVISAIQLKEGKVGYSFETFENSTVGDVKLAKGRFATEFDQTVELRIFAKTEASKAWVNNSINAKVILIVENKELGTAGEIKYEVYGWDAGLELNELVTTTEYADKVVYDLKFGGDATTKENTLPKSVFVVSTDPEVSSLSVTEAMLEGLLTLPDPEPEN